MTGIHVVQGKPVIGGNIIAAKVKAHPAYDYRIITNTADECEIAFYQGGQNIGHSTFTMKDAEAANLTNKPVWKQYPRNMLFNRAISNGARWYCPDVFSGVTVYTPEELDADNGHDIIDVTPTTTGPEWTPPAVEAGEDKPAPHTNDNRPLDADKVRRVCRKKALWFEEIEGSGEFRRNAAMEPITDGQVKALPGLMTKALSGMDSAITDKARHDIIGYLFGVQSTNELTKAEATAIIDWLKVPEDGNWNINAYATAETARILSAVAVEAGQAEMDLGA